MQDIVTPSEVAANILADCKDITAMVVAWVDSGGRITYFRFGSTVFQSGLVYYLYKLTEKDAIDIVGGDDCGYSEGD